ncbi:heavy metal translocating P-type ATPase [Spiribacter halobius]|uniref:Heavy metal translocating P-type ATPase n=2 Tax=Sediminicurvatus halobius TaxID=2182432 RepID=A0A2U2MVR2_9GAMM|nr:heavy metal translocating P-type ATPase [Spiribacter halobius]
MMCGSCAAAVAAVLQRQPGVLGAGVNFAADAASVRWNPARTSLEAICGAVTRLGYPARPLGDGDSGTPHAALRRALQLRLAVAVCFGMWSMMAAVLLYLGPLGPVEPWARWYLALASGVLALPVLGYSAHAFYLAGWRTLRAGVPGLDSLITLAVVAAVLISGWRLAQGSAEVYFDAAVMLVTFQLVARLIDHRVRRQAAGAVQAYLRALPEQALRLDSMGQAETVPVAALTVGDRVRIPPGERIAVDGTVVTGRSAVDCSMLTGESTPRRCTTGRAVLAGSRNGEGTLEVRVDNAAGRRRIDRLARSVRHLLGHKSALQRITDRMARALLPVVIVAATLAAALVLANGGPVTEAAARALAVLVITCPCALSLAVPLVAVMAISQAGRQALLFRDPAVLEAAAGGRTVVFDKTGTLTESTPAVGRVDPAPGTDRDELLRLAASASAGSHHPLGKALQGVGTGVDTAGARRVDAGDGITWDGPHGRVRVGRADWLWRHGIDVPSARDRGTEVCVARGSSFLGRIHFHERLRPEARAVIASLRNLGCGIRILSGDSPRACRRIADQLGLAPQAVLARRTPEAKRAEIEALQRHDRVIFVGDGQNDGLALAAAELGLAVGEAEPTARAAAAAILPRGISAVPDALGLARHARNAMHRNLAWALAYNALALPAALMGYVPPVIAAITMGSSTLCVLVNSGLFVLSERRRDAEADRNLSNRYEPALS